jgi:hypothetical protein
VFSVAPRATRTKIGMAEMPMAIMALTSAGPRNAARAMANIRNGQASIASVRRLITASVRPPTKPATMPTGTPSSTATATLITPAIRLARAPNTTRANTSRPFSSVPNQCAALGALRIVLQLVAMGSAPAISGANTAASTNTITSPSPTMAVGLDSKCRSARRPGLAGRVSTGAAAASAVMPPSAAG